MADADAAAAQNARAQRLQAHLLANLRAGAQAAGDMKPAVRCEEFRGSLYNRADAPNSYDLTSPGVPRYYTEAATPHVWSHRTAAPAQTASPSCGDAAPGLAGLVPNTDSIGVARTLQRLSSGSCPRVADLSSAQPAAHVPTSQVAHLIAAHSGMRNSASGASADWGVSGSGWLAATPFGTAVAANPSPGVTCMPAGAAMPETSFVSGPGTHGLPIPVLTDPGSVYQVGTPVQARLQVGTHGSNVCLHPSPASIRCPTPGAVPPVQAFPQQAMPPQPAVVEAARAACSSSFGGVLFAEQANRDNLFSQYQDLRPLHQAARATLQPTGAGADVAASSPKDAIRRVQARRSAVQ